MIFFRTILGTFLLVGLFVCPLVGQKTAKTSNDQPAVGRESIAKPFVIGEKLSYVGKLKKLGIFSFSLAQLDFEVKGTNEFGNYEFESVGKSRGSLIKLFNFKFLMNINSTVDAQMLQVMKTVKRDEQGKRIRNSVADFDYETRRVNYVESDPKEPTKAPRRISSEIVENTQDIVTAIYRLRGMELEVGKTFDFKISDSGLVYDVPVEVTAREQKKSKVGKRWCYRVEPRVFGPGRIIEQKGSLTIWITDDVDRVPVRAELETELGDVTIKLRAYSGLRSSKKTSNP